MQQAADAGLQTTSTRTKHTLASIRSLLAELFKAATEVSVRAMTTLTRARPPLVGHAAAAYDGLRPERGQGGCINDGRMWVAAESPDEIKTVQNEPKLRGRCAPWQKLRG